MISVQKNSVDLKELIAPTFCRVDYAIHNSLAFEYLFKGGRGSTKSSFISLQIVSGIIEDPQAHAVCVMKYGNFIRKSVLGQIEWAINMLGVKKYFKVNKSPAEVIYLPTGQTINFIGLDDASKTKSFKIPFGFVKFLWFEEFDNFAGMEEVRKASQSIIRGGNTFVFYSYNPPKSNRSWVNQEAMVLKPGRCVHTSTYLDVPIDWLGGRFIAEAEFLKENNPTAYQHEYLGEQVGTGTEIFNNLNIREIKDEEIKRFDNIIQGLDWGWVHNFAFERLHLDYERGKLYFIDEMYGSRLEDDDTSEWIIKNGYNRELTIADSEEPKSIDKFEGLGIWIEGAEKGKGSIKQGMKFLTGLNEIIIDPKRTPGAAKEFVNYALEKHPKTGELILEYPKKDDDTIAATRYAAERYSGVSDIVWG